MRGKEAVDFFDRISQHLKERNIAQSFLDELKELSDEATERGVLFSDISVIVAECP
jgi:hypothetical protein